MSSNKKIVSILLLLAFALVAGTVAVYRFSSTEASNEKQEYFEVASGKQIELSEFSKVAVATLEGSKSSVRERLFEAIGHSSFEQSSVVFLPEVHCNVQNKLNIAEAISNLARSGDIILLESTAADKKMSGIEAFLHTVIPNLSRAYYESTRGKYDARDNIRQAIFSQLKRKSIKPEQVWSSLQPIGWDDLDAVDKLRKTRVALDATLETIAGNDEIEVLERLQQPWVDNFGLSNAQASTLIGALKKLSQKDKSAVSDMNEVLLKAVFDLDEKDFLNWEHVVASPNALEIASMVQRNRGLFKTIKQLIKPQQKIFVTLGANHSPLMDWERDPEFMNNFYLSSTDELATSLYRENISYVVLKDKGAPWLQGC